MTPTLKPPDAPRKPIGSDFVPHLMKYTKPCSECDKKIKAGEMALASIRDGKVRKIVCSEGCRLEFDNNFWQGVAEKNLRRILR